MDVQFVAPLFQRPYVWNEDDNWDPLWQALLEVFERRLTGVNQRPYFLGALVLDQVPNAVGSVQAREIIDGQQRMTTLQIFMEVAKRIFQDHGLDHNAKLLLKLTRNDLESESDEQFKVWPTNIDRNAFRAVMTDKAPAGLMSQAAEFFEDRVMDWLKPKADGVKDRADALVTALKQDLVFVAIDLDNDDDGQLIFETLNSLGTPLLASDLVKNLLFREAMAQKLNTEQLYTQNWEPFEKNHDYWRAKVKVGRRERTRLDLFLQYYLTYKLGKEPVLAHQFRDYRDAFRDGKFGSTSEAMADFARHAQLWKEFDQAKEGAAGSLRHVLDLMDASVPNPLILGFFANVPQGVERDQMLAMLESYLFRRLLCYLTTKRLNLTTADLITTLHKNGWNSQALKNALMVFEGNSTVWPDDNAVINRLCHKPLYNWVRGTSIAYALSRVEASMRTDKSERNWNPRTPLTIEHIMPQQWEENWPMREGSTDDDKDRRNELINHVGNLTVLTQKLNSSISNGPWQDKRTHLNRHTVLLINSALAGQETWNEDAIATRSADLSKRFCALWPR